ARHVAALAADQVMVGIAADPLKQVVAGAEVGLGNQSQVLGRGQGAVDGGYVHERVDAAHLVQDLGRGDVSVSVPNAAEDKHALRRDLLAGPAEGGGGLLLTAHSGSFRSHPL